MIIEGPYRINPEFDGGIETSDGLRDIAMSMPDFAYAKGVRQEEHLDTLRLLAASWELREHLKLALPYLPTYLATPATKLLKEIESENHQARTPVLHTQKTGEGREF